MNKQIEQGKRIIRCARIGMIACRISEKMNISPLEALKKFYKSKTCRDLHDRKTGLYLYGDLYITNDFLKEINYASK